MYKLAGLDAGFLYNETERSPQHIASVQVLDIPEGTNPGEFIRSFKNQVLERIHRVPYFTNKLQNVPFGLDHPVWVRDDRFDIDNHIREVEVPAPGGRAEFEATVARVHARMLDRRRPLWEICVLTGLAGGRIAYYNRVHHACLDGVSGQAAIQAVMDTTPEPPPVEPAPPEFRDRPAGESPAGLFVGALENFAKFQIRQQSRWLSHVETALRLSQRAVDPGKGLGAVTEPAPRTRFNKSVYAERSYAVGELPLKDIRAIGKLTGATINDVFLALCSGALRSYLQRLGELPARSMIAGCPVSLRRRGDSSPNNQVTMMLVSFASDEPDPVKRLLKIVRSSAQAKGVVAAMADSYDADPALPGLPGLMRGGATAMEIGNLADSVLAPLACNMVISNVPGPRVPLYSQGARMLTHYPVSIPAHSQGANITVQSYLDQMFFGITGCARVLPDPQRLRDDLLAAFVELRKLTLAEEPLRFGFLERWPAQREAVATQPAAAGSTTRKEPRPGSAERSATGRAARGEQHASERAA